MFLKISGGSPRDLTCDPTKRVKPQATLARRTTWTGWLARKIGTKKAR